MTTRLLLPIAVAAAILACGGEEEESPPDATPSPAATSPAAAPPPGTPRGMTDGDFWFRGTVTEMNTGCYADATCSVTVEVAESLGGSPLAAGREIVVTTSYGFSTQPCVGQWAETPPGSEVEVLAHAAEGGSLAVCAGEHYFVKELGGAE
jgi:hypothetical protein